ncbi:MAG: hypothetical protein DK841_01000 [Candidatus Melainabacteria bacterium]|nr:MAG: hypothetical protein DK841_01000 [Candidatus Melainabacteria bacterium]
MERADLHLHSNFSDGSDSVETLVQNIKQEGLSVFALTDHDTIAGCKEIKKYITDDIKFISGTELTCLADTVKCHILGYNCNPDDETLTKLIQKGKQLRRNKLDKRIQYLSDIWNINLTQDELDWLYSRNSVVKIHIGNILVDRGLADNNITAMRKYLDGCQTGNTRFDGDEGISAIVASGGIPVWAHPLGGEGEEHLKADEFMKKLEIMERFGIQGLECYYSRYSKDETKFLVDIAKKHKLLISGGSDYHGKNKTVKLGQLNTEGTNIPKENLTILSAI